jgi:hypothetical protein
MYYTILPSTVPKPRGIKSQLKSDVCPATKRTEVQSKNAGTPSLTPQKNYGKKRE